MKVLNVVISVVILLLAIASAVLSYILFERRDQMIAGWDRYAATVSATVKDLDSKSADKLSAKLNEQTLDHRNVGKVDALLPLLKQRSAQIVAERDAFAEALRRIASIIDAKGIPGDVELCDLATYTESKNKIVNFVNDSISKRDNIYAQLNSISSRELNSSVDVAALKNGDSSALKSLDAGLKRQNARIAYYEKQLGAIHKVAGGSGSFNSTESGYQGSADNVLTSVKTQDANLRKTTADLSDANALIAKQKSELADRDALIAKQKGEIADRDGMIVGYRRALKMEDVANSIVPWKDGSAEARSAWVGKVVKVDRDYGYVVFDLGNSTTVRQKLGTGEQNVRVMPAAAMPIVIARGDLANSADFVARVFLVEIGDAAATANIPVGAEIREGDIAYIPMP